jgi:hypothetical protein
MDHHKRALTPAQQQEYQKTGRIPDDAFDKKKAAYMMKQFKLTLVDKDTGKTIETGPQEDPLNLDGLADQPFQTQPPPSEPPKEKESSKSKKKREQREKKREQMLKHQKPLLRQPKDSKK